jgi:hypothetical protein
MVAVVGVERKANKEVSELLLCDRPGWWGQGRTRDGTGWNRSIDGMKGRVCFGGCIWCFEAGFNF